jgi:hypothetical protein
MNPDSYTPWTTHADLKRPRGASKAAIGAVMLASCVFAGCNEAAILSDDQCLLRVVPEQLELENTFGRDETISRSIQLRNDGTGPANIRPEISVPPGSTATEFEVLDDAGAVLDQLTLPAKSVATLEIRFKPNGPGPNSARVSFRVDRQFCLSAILTVTVVPSAGPEPVLAAELRWLIGGAEASAGSTFVQLRQVAVAGAVSSATGDVRAEVRMGTVAGRLH